MFDLRARRAVPPQLADFARRRLAAACPPRRGWVPGADPAEEDVAASVEPQPSPALGAASDRQQRQRPAGRHRSRPETEHVGKERHDVTVQAGDAVDAAEAGVGAERPATEEADPPVPLSLGTALRVSGRAAFGLALVAVVALTLGASYLMRSRPEPVPGTRALRISSSPGPSISPTARPMVVVHVAGLVRHPGLQTLPAGARVADALRAGGGLARGADVTALNLARLLVDGEQVFVSKQGAVAPAPAAAGPSAAPGAGSAGSVLDLNTATPEQLQELPGVGPVLAGRIAQWRQEHGRFTTVEELQEVSGIGERKYAELAARVRV